MSNNTPAFLPTGEVRVPKLDEFMLLAGRYVQPTIYEMGDEYPIYRAVPADSVIELTPEVRCELAFARMVFAFQNLNDFMPVVDRYDKLMRGFLDGERTPDLADAMQRLTLSMTESEGDA